MAQASGSAMGAVRVESGVDLLNNIQEWRTRAKKIRVIAETILDAASRESLLQVANDWEWMAQEAEEPLREKEQQSRADMQPDTVLIGE